MKIACSLSFESGQFLWYYRVIKGESYGDKY
jgi:hypothetical protein